MTYQACRARYCRSCSTTTAPGRGMSFALGFRTNSEDNMGIHSSDMTEFLPLTNSLVSRIRWRLSDYEALLRAQVELLLDDENGEASKEIPASRQ